MGRGGHTWWEPIRESGVRQRLGSTEISLVAGSKTRVPPANRCATVPSGRSASVEVGFRDRAEGSESKLRTYRDG